LERCYLQRWGDGVKATDYNTEITINLISCVIEDCTANEKTHGVYAPAIKQVTARGCTFRNTAANSIPQPSRGHLFKSRARTNIIEGNLFDPVGGCACCMDIPNAGTLTVQGNIILHYGAAVNGDDNPPIKYGAEQNARSYPSWDGRVNSIKIAQNTFRKDQASWNGGAGSRIGILWVWDMTDNIGTPIFSTTTRAAAVIRNNIVAGEPCGLQTVTEFPKNSAAPRAAVNDLGTYSGARIPGDPSVNDASWTWAGDFRDPAARSDTFRGGI